MQIHKLLIIAPLFLAAPQVSLPSRPQAPLAHIASVPALPPTAYEPLAPLDTVSLPYSPIGTYANPYPPGQCTYGVASMKGNISWSGNADEWADKARALGITVSDVPIVGSVAQTSRGEFGHVATVVGIRPGQVLITEMNYDYQGSIRTDWQPVGSYEYIYV